MAALAAEALAFHKRTEGILAHALKARIPVSKKIDNSQNLSYVDPSWRWHDAPAGDGMLEPGDEADSLPLKILELLPVGIITLDNHGRVSSANPAAVQLFELDLEGMHWREIIRSKFNPRLDDGHEVSLTSGKRISLVTRSLGERDGQLIVINDLTETRALQERLNQQKRLSTIGKMVSSLAHQIRTPVAAAVLHAERLQRDASPGSTEESLGKKILSRLHSIERQIRDMLVFTRGNNELNDELSLAQFMEEIQEAAECLVDPASCSVAWSLTAPGQALVCRKDALCGAVLNLMENSAQAGASHISVQIGLEAAGNVIRIQVEDNGPGLDCSVAAGLGEDFVTSKKKGTGLGLAVVRHVACFHGGDFSIANGTDSGVVATIRIPTRRMGANP